MTPVRSWASAAVSSGNGPLLANHPALRNLTAVYELIARAGLTHMRPPFGIDFITVNGREVEVRVGEHDHVVLRAAERLAPLPRRRRGLVDVARDRRRARVR